MDCGLVCIRWYPGSRWRDLIGEELLECFGTSLAHLLIMFPFSLHEIQMFFCLFNELQVCNVCYYQILILCLQMVTQSMQHAHAHTCTHEHNMQIHTWEHNRNVHTQERNTEHTTYSVHVHERTVTQHMAKRMHVHTRKHNIACM